MASRTVTDHERNGVGYFIYNRIFSRLRNQTVCVGGQNCFNGFVLYGTTCYILQSDLKLYRIVRIGFADFKRLVGLGQIRT